MSCSFPGVHSRLQYRYFLNNIFTSASSQYQRPRGNLSCHFLKLYKQHSNKTVRKVLKIFAFYKSEHQGFHLFKLPSHFLYFLRSLYSGVWSDNSATLFNQKPTKIRASSIRIYILRYTWYLRYNISSSRLFPRSQHFENISKKLLSSRRLNADRHVFSSLPKKGHLIYLTSNNSNSRL